MKTSGYNLEAIRKEAIDSYRELADESTTVYAVTNARRENSAHTYSSDAVLQRFESILPRQEKAFEGAVKRMEEKARKPDNSTV